MPRVWFIAYFLTSLTGFVNLMLAGDFPWWSIDYAKQKVWRNPPHCHRIYTQASRFQVRQLTCHYSPCTIIQPDPVGCEAAVHAVRRFLESMPPGSVLVKLDFTNAFNCLHRPDMLNSVAERVPELLSYCHSAYAIAINPVLRTTRATVSRRSPAG